jgi:import inner membrane translocase subunit TIM44
LQVRHNNSFIRQVMEQVKKDMEQDEKGRKDWEAFNKTSSKVSSKTHEGAERLSDMADKAGGVWSRTANSIRESRERLAKRYEETQARMDSMSEQNESLKKAREFASSASGTLSDSTSSLFGATKGIFNRVMDKSSSTLSGLEEEKSTKLREWRANRASLAEAKARQEEAEAAAADKSKEPADKPEEATQAPPRPEETSVVVSDRNTSWDRFGTSMRDMPFLNAVFENPFFDRMFGESEIAASIREMKDMDSSFMLEEFYEDIENIVAPHVVSSFLEGDAEALERQCGEAAFAAVHASIKARKKQRLTLDSNILDGPRELELKGAKLMDKGAPMFIWTFNTQQVNCLRDKDGEVVEGAVDDIRTVHYAMVVSRHPDLENLDLEYPWIINELAIIGNQQSF